MVEVITLVSASYYVTNPFNPDKLWAMPREFSAGGVVARRATDGWEVAVIEPRSEDRERTTGKRPVKQVLALPKGLVDPGEKPEETAAREVFEETGLRGEILTKLKDIKYVYVRTWGDKQRVFKIVSFYLLRYQSGTIDQISKDMRIEVKQALWIPLADSEKRLSYRGEKEVIVLAQKYLQEHAEEAK
ncbi:MAG: NUDIX hydrolase [Acidobacteria bacterium]|nr:MAG: NUDIX hydrolase [Acidobacteriota bacterium]